MFTSNAAAVAKSLGKRKMREVGAETGNQFDLHNRLVTDPADGRRSRVQRILNNAAATPSKPFSYMALLTADEDEEGYPPISDEFRDPCDQINKMIISHNENLRQAVVGTVEKRLKEREVKLQEEKAELERLVDVYKGEAERLLIRLRYLERTCRYPYPAETVVEEEEAESSTFEDPDRVEPVRLDCKVCRRKLATVMVWPCRHVCVCTRCEVSTKFCPVCRILKTTGVEVSLPLD